MSRLTQLERLIAAVANLCIMAGIAVGLFTYLDQKHDAQALRKREAALQFAALRHESAIADASQALREALSKDGRYIVALGEQEEAKKSDAEKVVTEVGVGKIDALAKFYISVASCVETDVCDQGIIHSLFDEDIKFFYCATEDEIMPILYDRFYDRHIYDKLKEYFQKYIHACPPRPTAATLSETLR